MLPKQTSKGRNSLIDWLDSSTWFFFVGFKLFYVFNFLSPITLYSLIGLENGAMLLFGGWDESQKVQSGIWELDDKWTRIGELAQVWEKNSKMLILILIFSTPDLEVPSTSANQSIILDLITLHRARFSDWT